MCSLWIFVVSIALRMRWLDSITDSMDLNSSKLGNSRGQRSLASIVEGVAESLTQLGNWRTWKSTEPLTNSPEVYVRLGCFGRWGSWTAAENQTITDAPFMSSPTFYGLCHVTSLSPYLWFPRWSDSLQYQRQKVDDTDYSVNIFCSHWRNWSKHNIYIINIRGLATTLHCTMLSSAVNMHAGGTPLGNPLGTFSTSEHLLLSP